MLLSLGMQTRVLLIDDDQTRSPALKRLFSSQSFRITTSADLDHAHQKIDQTRFDIIVIQHASKISHLSTFVQQIRNTGLNTVIFVLIEKSTSLQRIELLKAGADDCLSSPFHPDEVILRIEKILFRHYETNDRIIKTNYLQLDPSTGRVWGKWGETNLRKKELLILKILVQHPNQAVPKQKIIEMLWSVDETPLATTVDVHIGRIRVKIQDFDKTRIKTLYGMGYMFCDKK